MVNYSNTDAHFLPLIFPKGQLNKVSMFHTSRVQEQRRLRAYVHYKCVTLDSGGTFSPSRRSHIQTHTQTHFQWMNQVQKNQTAVDLSVLWRLWKKKNSIFIVPQKTTEPSMSKSHVVGIHQREQRAAFPCCTIMRHDLRDMRVCSARPECNVTGCGIKDGPSFNSCTSRADLYD